MTDIYVGDKVQPKTDIDMKRKSHPYWFPVEVETGVVKEVNHFDIRVDWPSIGEWYCPIDWVTVVERFDQKENSQE